MPNWPLQVSQLRALNIVLEPVLDGGVSVSRRLDPMARKGGVAEAAEAAAAMLAAGRACRRCAAHAGRR